MRARVTASGLLSVASSVFAQPGVATYSIAFGSASGPSSVVLEQGQSVGVFVNVSFSPGVGSGNPPVAGLSDGAFSISASGPGGGLWLVDINTSSPTYSLPFPWNASGAVPGATNPGAGGQNGVTGVVWGYGFLFSLPHPYPQNPANVWRGKFMASSAGEITTNFAGMSPTGVFTGVSGIGVVTVFASQGLPGQITIIPAPGTLGLACAGLLAARRRRSSR